MLRISYKKLKSNYSTKVTSIHKCTMHFPNTCAIRLSEALIKTEDGFLEKFKVAGQNKCPHFYIRGAQDLAAILAKPDVLGARTHGWTGTQSGTVPTSALGKTGIICYMNIPGFSGQGHIDLWDGNAPVGDEYWNAKTIWMWNLRP